MILIIYYAVHGYEGLSMSSLRLRLQRLGRLHKPFYRIVACHRKAKRDGKFHEILGTYNPIPDAHGNKQVTLKVDRIKHWMMIGAEPSERVAKILGIAEVLPPPPRRYLPQALLPDADSGDASDDFGDSSSAAEHDNAAAPAQDEGGSEGDAATQAPS